MTEEVLFEKHYKKIRKVLNYADTSAYYHNLFEEANIDLSKDITYEDFKRIPKTDKFSYEKNKYGMISSKMKLFDREKMNQMKKLQDRLNYLMECGMGSKITSGSTGQPLEVLKSNRDVFRDYVVLNEYRKRMTDYDFSGCFVQVWPVNAAIYKKYYPEKELVEYVNANERGFLYYLSEHSTENLMKLYYFLYEKECEWITSSPTVLYKLSKMIFEKELPVPIIKYVECHSEKLYGWQREMIDKVFQCDIASIYSSNEVQFVGGECKCGRMHLFEKACFLEIIPDENGHNEILLTSLNYCDIPMIRYKIGDCGKWFENQECECEFGDCHSFEIYGFRKNDYIKTPQGDIEPFLIADSVYTLVHENRINIQLYRAVQNEYNKFTYFIPQEVIDSSGEIIKRKIEEFLCTGLKRDDIEVSIAKFDLDESTYYSRKFRYFESQVK